MAEILRRYLEEYHALELPEELSLLTSPSGDEYRQLYGSSKLLDFDRKVLRRIVREFKLDPQARTTWFVEGDTEVAFARRWAERSGVTLERLGIDVMNFRGL